MDDICNSYRKQSNKLVIMENDQNVMIWYQQIPLESEKNMKKYLISYLNNTQAMKIWEITDAQKQKNSQMK